MQVVERALGREIPYELPAGLVRRLAIIFTTHRTALSRMRRGLRKHPICEPNQAINRAEIGHAKQIATF